MAPLRTETTDQAPAVDICIVGAGITGLALARALALACPGQDILLLEKNDQIGAETSSRNSEVIHAGIYYPADSLKAAMCIRGRELLYDYCKQRGITHRRIGKLIVGDAGDVEALEQIHQRARACGITTLQFIDSHKLASMEPHVQAELALWSPDTGIVDSHNLMQHLLMEAQQAGVTLALRSRLLSAEPQASGQLTLLITSGTETVRLNTRVLINCAGLHATALAQRINGLKAAHIPAVDFIKGNYFSLSGRSPFSHLIYPLPDPLRRGLGVHATLDLAGQCRFGPDIEVLSSTHADELDYAVDAQRARLFAEAITKYYPAIDYHKLQPSYCGVRPRLRTDDRRPGDFIIQGPQTNGIPGLWQLFGIESPGLTASLALAEQLSAWIRDSDAY